MTLKWNKEYYVAIGLVRRIKLHPNLTYILRYAEKISYILCVYLLHDLLQISLSDCFETDKLGDWNCFEIN